MIASIQLMVGYFCKRPSSQVSFQNQYKVDAFGENKLLRPSFSCQQVIGIPSENAISLMALDGTMWDLVVISLVC